MPEVFLAHASQRIPRLVRVSATHHLPSRFTHAINMRHYRVPLPARKKDRNSGVAGTGIKSDRAVIYFYQQRRSCTGRPDAVARDGFILP